MKIVQIIPSLLTGGAEAMVLNLSLSLCREHQVTVISQFAKKHTHYEKMLEESGVQVIYLDKKVGFDFHNMRAITKILKNMNPDAVHTHLDSGKYVIQYYLKRRKCAKIHTVHNIAAFEFGRDSQKRSNIHHRIMSFMYKWQGVIPVALSEIVKESIEKDYGISGVPVVYNGIDISRFENRHRVIPDRFTIVNVASFNAVKNQKLLVEAFLDALTERPDMQLVLVGDGSERKNVEALAAENQNIQFVGITDNVKAYLHAASVFCLCSTVEGIPLSILEAYAAGLPVIATNVGGVSDMLTDGENGILIESENRRELKDAILYLAKHPEVVEKNGKANMEKVKKYDIHRTSAEYLGLYDGHRSKKQ